MDIKHYNLICQVSWIDAGMISKYKETDMLTHFTYSLFDIIVTLPIHIYSFICPLNRTANSKVCYLKMFSCLCTFIYLFIYLHRLLIKLLIVTYIYKKINYYIRSTSMCLKHRGGTLYSAETTTGCMTTELRGICLLLKSTYLHVSNLFFILRVYCLYYHHTSALQHYILYMLPSSHF